MSRSKILIAGGAVLLLATFFTHANLLDAAAPAVHAAPPAVHAAPAVAFHPHISAPRSNPHLHGAAERPVRPIERPDLPEHRNPADRTEKARSHEEWEHWRHHWHYRWSYITWVVLHRGLGSVHGIAYNAAGLPSSGIRLTLRKPSGGHIHSAALRHTTHSDATGSFTMSGVRLGRYRVQAQEGKSYGHTAVSVHPGVMSFVSVKL